MKLPPSFAVDHTRMSAPAVRRAAEYRGPRGDVVTKFDLRLLRPNQDAFPTAGMHTLEHCLATFLPEHLADVIDLSPMGCRTGFYLTCFGTPSEEQVGQAVLTCLEKILTLGPGDIPGVSEKSCGNWRDHSLFTAQQYVKQILGEWER